MIKYLVKNLKNLFRENGLIFVVIVLASFLAAVIICFSYGVYQHYQEEGQIAENRDTEIWIRILEEEYGEGAPVTKSKIDACLQRFSSKFCRNLEAIDVYPLVDTYESHCKFTYRDGEYGVYETFKNNLLRQGLADNFYTDEQMQTGAYVVLIDWNNKYKTPNMDSLYNEEDNSVLLQGERYEVIGLQEWCIDSVMVPYTSLKEDTVLYGSISFSFTRGIRKSDYEEIKAVLTEELGGAVLIPDWTGGESIETGISNTILLVCLLIGIVILLNINMLYRYVLLARRKQMEIFHLCGLTKGRLAGLYLGECLGLLTLLFLAGLFVFDRFLLPVCCDIYPYMEGMFGLKIYAGMLVVYILSAAVILGATIAGSIKKHMRARLW